VGKGGKKEKKTLRGGREKGGLSLILREHYPVIFLLFCVKGERGGGGKKERISQGKKKGGGREGDSTLLPLSFLLFTVS